MEGTARAYALFMTRLMRSCMNMTTAESDRVRDEARSHQDSGRFMPADSCFGSAYDLLEVSKKFLDMSLAYKTIAQAAA